MAELTGQFEENAVLVLDSLAAKEPNNVITIAVLGFAVETVLTLIGMNELFTNHDELDRAVRNAAKKHMVVGELVEKTLSHITDQWAAH